VTGLGIAPAIAVNMDHHPLSAKILALEPPHETAPFPPSPSL
jgi:hypothetical protein